MKTQNLLLAGILLILASCSKKNDNPNTTPAADSFINTTTGSTWNYHLENNSAGTSSDYTLTSTNQDTTIESRKYHVYQNSTGGNQYLSFSGHDYYEYESIPGSEGIGGIAVARLYLKDDLKVGDTWKQDFTFTITVSGFPVSVPLTVTNTITEKGGTRTIQTQEYKDVTHVSSVLSSASVPTGLTSSIDSYFAPKYGLIENTTVVTINYLGITEDVNIKTQLLSADLK